MKTTAEVETAARHRPGFGLTPEQRAGLVRHARAELEAGHVDAAYDAARALTVLDPVCHDGWVLLAAVHRRAGREGDAIVAAQVAEALEVAS